MQGFTIVGIGARGERLDSFANSLRDAIRQAFAYYRLGYCSSVKVCSEARVELALTKPATFKRSSECVTYVLGVKKEFSEK